MMSESPVLGDIRALLFRFRPHNLRPLVIEEPIGGLKEENKPGCFGCYGDKICVGRTTPPNNCPWEQRCYNSRRDC
jgi:hypothetical protein